MKKHRKKTGRDTLFERAAFAAEATGVILNGISAVPDDHELIGFILLTFVVETGVVESHSLSNIPDSVQMSVLRQRLAQMDAGDSLPN